MNITYIDKISFLKKLNKDVNSFLDEEIQVENGYCYKNVNWEVYTKIKIDYYQEHSSIDSSKEQGISVYQLVTKHAKDIVSIVDIINKKEYSILDIIEVPNIFWEYYKGHYILVQLSLNTDLRSLLNTNYHENLLKDKNGYIFSYKNETTQIKVPVESATPFIIRDFINLSLDTTLYSSDYWFLREKSNQWSLLGLDYIETLKKEYGNKTIFALIEVYKDVIPVKELNITYVKQRPLYKEGLKHYKFIKKDIYNNNVYEGDIVNINNEFFEYNNIDTPFINDSKLKRIDYTNIPFIKVVSKRQISHSGINLYKNKLVGGYKNNWFIVEGLPEIDLGFISVGSLISDHKEKYEISTNKN